MEIQEKFVEIKGHESIYRIAKCALSYYSQSIISVRHVSLLKISIADVKKTKDDLEQTYMVRMFSDFEFILRDYWKEKRLKTMQPKMFDLMFSISAFCSISRDVHDAVDDVRDKRNQLIHNGINCDLPLEVVRQRLCNYLGLMPRFW